jgi:hypothetical protein
MWTLARGWFTDDIRRDIMARRNWVRVRIEKLISRNGSEHIRNERELYFNKEPVTEPLTSASVTKPTRGRKAHKETISEGITCDLCGIILLGWKKLRKHQNKVHDSSRKLGGIASVLYKRETPKRKIATPCPADGVRATDLAKELKLRPSAVVQQARIRGANIDLPYERIPFQIAQELRLALKRTPSNKRLKSRR